VGHPTYPLHPALQVAPRHFFFSGDVWPSSCLARLAPPKLKLSSSLTDFCPPVYIIAKHPSFHSFPPTAKMSRTVEIQSPEQFSELLQSSRIVVADCK
jgi:hypothetical protein